MKTPIFWFKLIRFFLWAERWVLNSGERLPPRPEWSRLLAPLPAPLQMWGGATKLTVAPKRWPNPNRGFQMELRMAPGWSWLPPKTRIFQRHFCWWRWLVDDDSQHMGALREYNHQSGCHLCLDPFSEFKGNKIPLPKRWFSGWVWGLSHCHA